MIHIRRTSVLPVFVVLYFAFLASCQSTDMAVPPSAPGISVGISSEICPGIEAQVGEEVTWTNQDNREHIVRDRTDETVIQFESGSMAPGDSFSYVFQLPGKYSYDCSADGKFTGTITIQPHQKE